MYNNCGFNLCGNKNNETLWIVLIIVVIYLVLCCDNSNIGNNGRC